MRNLTKRDLNSRKPAANNHCHQPWDDIQFQGCRVVVNQETGQKHWQCDTVNFPEFDVWTSDFILQQRLFTTLPRILPVREFGYPFRLDDNADN